jgi:hypothetical protein
VISLAQKALKIKPLKKGAILKSALLSEIVGNMRNLDEVVTAAQRDSLKSQWIFSIRLGEINIVQ